MNALTFPAGRALAGWWRQLETWQPRAFWVGQLTVHAVDALVERHEPSALAPLELLVLKALTLGPKSGADQLSQRLHLDRQFLAQLLRSLGERGLACAERDAWTVTPVGQSALSTGSYPRAVHERQVFFFRAGCPQPHFLSLEQPLLQPSSAGETAPFDPAALETCVAGPLEWKQQHGFPVEVAKVLGPASAPPEWGGAWQRVIFARLLRTLVALVQVRQQGAERLLGFTALPQGGQLQPHLPVLSLAPAAQTAFADLAVAPSAEEWQQAWLAWCRQRGQGELAALAHAFSLDGVLLKVEASAPLCERLRNLRTDVLQEEGWLLAGSGPIRRAARLNFVARE